MKKRQPSVVICAAILLGFSVLAGCVNFKRSYPEKRRFVLDVTRGQTAQKAGDGAVLRVRKFDISPRYEGRGLVYRTDELTYTSDFYNEFFISPNLLVTEEARKWLAASALFNHVTDAATYVEEDYVLHGTIVALYGDYRDRSAPRAAVELQLALTQIGHEGPRIVFERSYNREELISSSEPGAVVGGMNKALAAVLRQLEDDLGEVIQKDSGES